MITGDIKTINAIKRVLRDIKLSLNECNDENKRKVLDREKDYARMCLYKVIHGHVSGFELPDNWEERL